MYNELYLQPNMGLHRLLFIEFAENEKYSFPTIVDAYMRTSEIRAKQDVGNWSALNKGWKQLYNSVDFTLCLEKTKEERENWYQYKDDLVLLHWLADIYVLFQWKYDIPSKLISEKIDTLTLIKCYNPLHECSHDKACEKLLHKFFPDKEKELDERNEKQ